MKNRNPWRVATRFLAFVVLLLPVVAFSQSSVDLGVIQNAANRGGDKSMALLELVYGSVVHNPLSASGGSGGMFAAVMLVLNSCLLAVGVIWSLYHFTSAMIATGQDGEFMGQKKSSPWFIVRMSFGFTGLVPMFGGYCGAQVIMLWGTLLGVGIANLTLDAGVAMLATGGSMIATPASPQATTVAKALFEANLCAQAANTAISNMPAETGVSVDPAEKFSVLTTANKIVLMNQYGLSCGGAEITISLPEQLPNYDGMAVYSVDTASIRSQMLSAHQAALTALQAAVSAAAQSYVTAINSQAQPPDALTAINNAALGYQSTITKAISGSSSSINGLASIIKSNLLRDGWIMMGAWYQTFAQANSQVTNLANSTASAVPGTDIDNLPYPQLLRKVLAAYGKQSQQAASTKSASELVDTLSTSSTDPKTFLSRIVIGQKLVTAAIGLNSGQGTGGATNPLIGMKNLGDYILDAGWAGISAYGALKALEGASNSNGGKLLQLAGDIGTGGLLGAATGAAKGLLDALGPFVIIMILTLFFFGATLSIYIPMLPFVIWFSGVMSWYAVVGESIVAAPLWSVTHLDGDGEGMGQRPTHGYIFLLNVMFRPVFMQIGFILGGAGIMVLGTLLNSMFAVAMANAQFDSVTGLVSIVGFICLYVSMCITLCNTSFSLIHIVPDQVFAWIGGQMAARMPEIEDKVQRMFGAGVHQGSQNSRSIPGAGGRGSEPPAATPTIRTPQI